MGATANIGGTAGNAIDTLDTSAGASWGAVDLEGGLAEETVTIDANVYSFYDDLITSATGVLTLSANVSDADTVTIGSHVYTFKDDLNEAATGILTLTDTMVHEDTITIDTKTYVLVDAIGAQSVDGRVLIGATASDTIDNLIAAINLDAGASTLYSANTTLHPHGKCCCWWR